MSGPSRRSRRKRRPRGRPRKGHRRPGKARPDRVPASPERDAAIVAAYSSADCPGMNRIGDSFGVSREAVRIVVRRWEQESGETILPAPQRRRRAKDAARARIKPPTVAQRLLKKARLVPETGCWEWLGRMQSSNGGSYPSFSALGQQFAHRVAFELWRGPIPKGHVLVRQCAMERCINPFHREETSNSAAMAARVRPKVEPPTHCKRGHEFTPENTTWNTVTVLRDGQRVRTRHRLCRICALDRQKRNYTPAPRRPPLPEDEAERWVERAIRAVENAHAADRPETLSRHLEIYGSGDVEVTVPPLDGEPYEDYRERTRHGWGEWFAARVTGSPRVQKALRARPRKTTGKEQDSTHA